MNQPRSLITGPGLTFQQSDITRGQLLYVVLLPKESRFGVGESLIART